MKAVLHMLRKEFIQIFRDRFMVAIIFFVPLVQLFILAYAITTDVKHLSTVICDLDNSHLSRELISRFRASGYFDLNYFTRRPSDLKKLLDREKAVLALVIPAHFSRDLKKFSSPQVQLIIDGQNSNASVIALGYSLQIIQRFLEDQLKGFLGRMPELGQYIHIIEPELRVWYNPNLKSAYYMIPGIIALLLTIITMLLTSLAIVREQEIGTWEQLMVTPLKPYQLILGKIIPFALLGYLEFLIALGIALLWWRIPFLGSIFLLAGFIAVYILTTLGLGILISTLARTQQQALFLCWFVAVSCILLSGFFFPIENMPRFFQYLTYLDPLRYFICVLREIILKGAGIEHLLVELIGLLVIGAGVFSLSLIRFQKRVS